MKSTLIGQAFMLPSYAFIVAAIVSSGDMGLFLTFMALSFVATFAGIYIGYRWINKRFPA